MRVGTKLATGFLLVVLLILLTLLFCSAISRRTHEKLEALKNVVAPDTILANKVDIAVSDADHAIMEYLIQGTAQEKENAQFAFAQLEKVGPKHFGSETHTNPGESEATRELIVKIRSFISVGLDIIKLKDQGVNSGELLKTKVEKLHSARKILLEQLRKHKVTRMEELADAEEAVSGAYILDVRLTLLVTVLGVLLTVVVTFVTTRSIVKPLKALNKGAEIVNSGGKLDYKIETEAKDEIGQLSRAFGKETKKLMETTALVEKLNKEIAERKIAERERQLAEDKYRTIFENSAVAISLVDEQERLISWNKFTENLLGMNREDLYLRPIKSLYPEGHWQMIRNHDVRQKGIQHHLETQMIKKNGDLIDVDISLSVLKNPEGEVIGSIGVVRDITERKRAEEELKKTMEMKSQFISMVSHELRIPLTAVKMSIDFIVDRLAGEINEEQEELLNVSKRNIDRLTRLINEVLTFQKLVSGKAKFDMETRDVNKIVRDVYEMMARTAKEKKLDFSIVLEDGLPKVELDSDQISQVMTNLVHNAIKFTEKGGITIATSKYDHTIRISVSDTGCGIKKEDMPRLFKEFEQLERKKGSTGLGLSICKKIVEQHKGEIWAESEPGKGTAFHFVLPTEQRRKA